MVDEFDFNGMDYRTYTCPDCEGDGGEMGDCMGKLIWIKCDTCLGHGIVSWEELNNDD